MSTRQASYTVYRLLIDRRIKDRLTVYRTPGARSSTVRVWPLLSTSGTGVQMSWGFQEQLDAPSPLRLTRDR